MKRIFIVMFTVCILFGIGIYLRPSKQEEHIVEALSGQKYEQIRRRLVTVTKEATPKEALGLLEQLMNKNPAVMRDCHSLAHSIGHTAFEKYPTFAQAMEFQNEVCNSGYIHGVLEKVFASGVDIPTSIQTLCTRYKTQSFRSWECYHGIGHGLMAATNNDVIQSVSYCEKLNDSSMRHWCVNGVYMENFNTDQSLHPTKFLKADDMFYPCMEQKDEYQGECIIYTPIYFLSRNIDRYHDALEWCKQAPLNYESGCIRGVASESMKQQFSNPNFTENLCSTLPESKQATCISGMISQFINHTGSLASTEKLCTTLKKEHQDTCHTVVTGYKPMFSEESNI